MLHLSDNGNSASIKFLGDYTQANFSAPIADNHGGTLVIDKVA